MIESIIRRYKLYRKSCILSKTFIQILYLFWPQKWKNLNLLKNKKAYSYFGTICKNYLLGQLLKADKRMKSDLII